MSHLKIEAARRQLGHALDLFLQDRDPVSVHCLAGGGCGLIEYHATKAGGEPFTSFMLKTNPDLDIKTIRKRQRQYWTAFKHATTHEGDERDDDHLLSRFTDENNDVALYVGWYDYGQAVRAMPVEAQAYLTWYAAMNIEKMNPNKSREPYEIKFPNVRALPRIKQKQMLTASILRARGNNEVMSDPRTERRPLVLGGHELARHHRLGTRPRRANAVGLLPGQARGRLALSPLRDAAC
jgi:hypothetical protein